MKRLKSLLTLIFLSIILFSCGSDNSQLIIGKWNEVDTGESVCNYNADGTFEHNLDNDKTEKGTWRVEGNQLFTTYEGGEELPADEIAQLDKENLVIVIAGRFQTSYKRAE